MYKSGKKLLYTTILCSALTLGGLSLAQAMEPKIPIDGKVIKTETKEFNVDQYQGTITTKTLENGIIVQDFDYGSDGKIEGSIIRQEFPDGHSMQELDRGADRNIEVRGTFYTDGSIMIEEQLPDGSVKTESFKYKSD